MGDVAYYNEKLPEITAIKDKDIIKFIKIPVAIYIQEAENFCKLYQTDKELFINAGLNWKIIEDIPKRIGALREAEARWNTARLLKQENTKNWQGKANEVYKLRNSLLHKFRYAYRNNQQLKKSVNMIVKNNSYAAAIQNINDLVVFGKKNLKPLNTIKFTLTELNEAALFAKKMADLYAKITAKKEYHITKKIRNQAYTYLKVIIDETNACGKYVYWYDSEKRKRYTSSYLRKYRKKPVNNKE